VEGLDFLAGQGEDSKWFPSHCIKKTMIL
jgi:hypothetical protein